MGSWVNRWSVTRVPISSSLGASVHSIVSVVLIIPIISVVLIISILREVWSNSIMNKNSLTMPLTSGLRGIMAYRRVPSLQLKSSGLQHGLQLLLLRGWVLNSLIFFGQSIDIRIQSVIHLMAPDKHEFRFKITDEPAIRSLCSRRSHRRLSSS
jgi:hypothetical protein